MKTLQKAMIITGLIFSLLLIGCTKNNAAGSERTALSELISAAPDEEIDIKPLESISAGVKDEKAYYTFSGDRINIEYQYSAVGPESVGIMVLCDGIAVPFSTDISPEEKLLQIIPDIPSGETIDIVLSFTPIGKKGDDISVEIVDVVEPDFDISALDLTQPLNAFIRGKKYLVNYISGISVTMLSDGLDNEAQISTEYEMAEISDEIIEQNKVMNDDGTVSNKLNYFSSEWSVENERSLAYSVDKGDVLDISIIYCGTSGQDILTSFYIDNELFPVFDTCGYSKCFADDAHYTAIAGHIDTATLEKGRHICYSVCGNIENSMTIPTAAFIIEVK